MFGNSAELENEAVSEAEIIPVAPLALTSICPSFVLQFDTSFWNTVPLIGINEVFIDWVIILSLLSFTYNTKERVGNKEAVIIGWNKPSTGV